MSEKRRERGIDIVKERIHELDLELFKRVSDDILERRKTGDFSLSISNRRTVAIYSQKVLDSLLETHRIEQDVFGDMLEVLANMLRYSLQESEEDIYKQLKDKAVLKKAKEMVLFAKEKLRAYPEIETHFHVISSCRTNYLEDVDWEIDFKSQSSSEEEQKIFPVCVMEITTRSPAEDKKDILTIELSSDNLNRLIKNFSEARDEFRKVRDKKIEVA